MKILFFLSMFVVSWTLEAQEKIVERGITLADYEYFIPPIFMIFRYRNNP